MPDTNSSPTPHVQVLPSGPALQPASPALQPARQAVSGDHRRDIAGVVLLVLSSCSDPTAASGHVWDTSGGGLPLPCTHSLQPPRKLAAPVLAWVPRTPDLVPPTGGQAGSQHPGSQHVPTHQLQPVHTMALRHLKGVFPACPALGTGSSGGDPGSFCTSQ